MIFNDSAAIPEHFVEEWTREIAAYVEKYSDNMAARKILPVRTVGADTAIDVVVTYDRTNSAGASIVAKGAIPDSIGVKQTTTKHDIFQIATGFNINAKDLKLDPKSKNRLIDIAMRDIHRAEDDLAINGNTQLNVNGIVQAAQANTNGKIVASGATDSDTNNKGKWTGETGTDIYADIVEAISKMDGDYEPAFLLASRAVMNNLNRMDSERRPYRESVATLFGKKDPKDSSWMFISERVPTGKAYLLPKDFMAAEFIVSENPRPITYPMGPGQNFWVEIACWVTVEIHDNNAFVEIDTN